MRGVSPPRGVAAPTDAAPHGSTVQVKHYKVNRVDRGYVIDVDARDRAGLALGTGMTPPTPPHPTPGTHLSPWDGPCKG